MNPRESIEAAESEAELSLQHAANNQAAFVLGRVLIWMLSTGPKGTLGTLESIGVRACVVAYKLRPDLINGMTLNDIATMRSCSDQFVHKLAKEFSETFDAKGMNGKSLMHRKRMADSWSRVHPTAKLGVSKLSHLAIINRFSQWFNSGRHKRMTETQLQQDFKPVMQFVKTIYRFD